MLKLVSGRVSSWPNRPIAVRSLLLVVLCSPLCGILSASDLHRIRTEVEIKGKLRLNPTGRGVETRSLVAKGQIACDQRIEKPNWAARYYLHAEAKATIGISTIKRSLRSSHRSVAVQSSNSQIIFHSPAGPLTQDELDVLEAQFDPLLLHKLVPDRVSRKGATAKASHEQLAALLFVDVIHKSNISAEVVEVADSNSKIRVKGKASGAVDGVSTEIQVDGYLRYNLDSRSIERVTISIRENRSIGHASPGFDVTATIRTAITPIADSQLLTPEALESLLPHTDGEQQFIAYSSKHAGIRLSHDERWRVMMDRPETLVLRMIDRGDLIGQCNISRLSALQEGERLTLEKFKSSVREALGDNFGEIVSSSQRTTEIGIEVLRVAVTGTVSGLAVNWVYYHVSNDSGQRVSLVFTSEAELADRFAASDRAIVASLRFTEPAREAGASQPDNSVDQADSRIGSPTRRE